MDALPLAQAQTEEEVTPETADRARASLARGGKACREEILREFGRTR
ncbi:MAG: hypothetical protein K2X35_09260 [Bryobacteraceae bacterium]|nr:hypothetical protein [Bryobacteraceae bacterium]